MNLIIMGPPGAGKGTQAKLLSKGLNLKHISTGEIFREIISENSELANKVKGYVLSGQLVPDELVMNCLKEKFPKENGFILDGVPRNVTQLNMLEEFLKSINRKIDALILLNLSDEIIIERLSNRRVCPVCKKEYNLKTLPPREDCLCDICGVELKQRPDDTPEAIKKRLDVYHSETTPIIRSYKGKIIEIEANKSVEEIYKDIIQRLNKQ